MIQNGVWIVILVLAGCASQSNINHGSQVTPGSEFHDRVLNDCNVADFDQPPIVLSGSNPKFPAGRLMAGEQGVTSIRFIVSEKGEIIFTSDDTTGSHFFANHVRAAMKTWVVRPASRAGKPVQTVCAYKAKFQIS